MSVFAPWIEDPDPPNCLTDEQTRQLSEEARSLLKRENS
jgi:hypothetical protein